MHRRCRTRMRGDRRTSWGVVAMQDHPKSANPRKRNHSLHRKSLVIWARSPHSPRAALTSGIKQAISIIMNWRLAEEPIRPRRFRSASIRRSRFPASGPQSDPAGFPIPAGARGPPTSPHARLSSIDTPNQQCCNHRSRSDWRSRRPHLYHRSLFTDFLHYGADIAA